MNHDQQSPQDLLLLVLRSARIAASGCCLTVELYISASACHPDDLDMMPRLIYKY